VKRKWNSNVFEDMYVFNRIYIYKNEIFMLLSELVLPFNAIKKA